MVLNDAYYDAKHCSAIHLAFWFSEILITLKQKKKDYNIFI